MGESGRDQAGRGHSACSSTKTPSRSSEKAVGRHWVDEALIWHQGELPDSPFCPQGPGMKSPRPGPLAQGFLSLSLVSFFLPSLSSYASLYSKLALTEIFSPSVLENHILKLRLYRWGLRYTKDNDCRGGMWGGKGGTSPWGHSRPLRAGGWTCRCFCGRKRS